MRTRRLAVSVSAAAALFGASGAAKAESWVKVSAVVDGGAAEVDRDSVVRDGQKIVAVIRVRPSLEWTSYKYDEQIATLRFDCTARTVQILHQEAALKGQVLTTQGASNVTAITNGSATDKTADIACGSTPVANLADRPWLAIDWTFAKRGQDGSIWEYDRSTFRREADQATVLLRIRSNPKGVQPSAEDGYQILRRFYCAERTFQNLHTELIEHHRIAGGYGVEEKRQVNSDTIGEAIFKAACPEAATATPAPTGSGRAVDLFAPGAWVIIGRPGAYTGVFEYDPTSVSRQGDQVTVTLRARYSKLPTAKPDDPDGFVTRRRFDCSGTSHQDLKLEYVLHGHVLRTEEPREKETTHPGTLADTLKKTLCGPAPAASTASKSAGSARPSTASVTGRAVDLSAPEGWASLGYNQENTSFEYDPRSIIRQGDQVTVIMKVRYGSRAPQSRTGGAAGYLAQHRIYCSENAYQDLHTEYVSKGIVARMDDNGKRMFAQPGSIYDTLSRKVCGTPAAAAPASAAAPATGRPLDLAAPGAWLEFGRLSNGTVFEYDSASLRRLEDQVTVSIRGRPPAALAAEGWQASRRIFCAENAFGDLRKDYVLNGHVTRTVEGAPKEVAHPNTPADALHRKVCGAALKTASASAAAPAAKPTTAALGSAVDLSASGWVRVGRGDNGTTVEYDPASLMRQGDQVTVSVRARFAANASHAVTGGYDGFVAKRRFDCREDTFQDLHVDLVAAGRVSVSAEMSPKQASTPGTVGGEIAGKVCAAH